MRAPDLRRADTHRFPGTRTTGADRVQARRADAARARARARLGATGGGGGREQPGLPELEHGPQAREKAREARQDARLQRSHEPGLGGPAGSLGPCFGDHVADQACEGGML
jgi:hypothetical protein